MFLHHRVFILSPKLHLETRPDTGCSIDDVTLPEFEFFFFVIQKIQTNTLASPSHQPCHEIFSHLCWLNWYTNETLPYRLQNRFSHLWLSLGGSVNKCTKVPVWNRLCQTQTRSQFLWLENMQNPYCDFTNDTWMPSPIIHCCPISYNKKSITYRMNIAFHW